MFALPTRRPTVLPFLLDLSDELGRLGLEILKPVSLSPLSGKRTEPPAFVMDAIADNEFVIREGEAAGRRVNFVLNADGSVRFIQVHGRLADRVAS